MTDDDGRPSPEDLLPLAMGDERRQTEGRLTVYLGYAAGVGKTYTMLADALAMRSEGADIVIGYVETHGRPETDALAARLETVPPATIEYQALRLREMDLDGVVARRPDVALVDELAHAMAPGSRHAKRYQEIEELLRAGISVWTTVNVQHIESERDAVARITGVQGPRDRPRYRPRTGRRPPADRPAAGSADRAAARRQGLRAGHGGPGGRALLRAGQPDRTSPARAPVRRRGRGPGDGRADAGPGDPGPVARSRTGARRGPDRAVCGPDGPGRVPDGEPAPGRVDRALGRDGAGPGGRGGGSGPAPQCPGDGQDARGPGRAVPCGRRGRRDRPIRPAQQRDHDPAGQAARGRDSPLSGLPGHAGDGRDRAPPGRSARPGYRSRSSGSSPGPRSPRRGSPFSWSGR